MKNLNILLPIYTLNTLPVHMANIPSFQRGTSCSFIFIVYVFFFIVNGVLVLSLFQDYKYSIPHYSLLALS